jgi:predicted lipoprotein with Yx(FWY)xxD motif
VQITYDKVPLYLFANHGAAGDVNGQWVKNVWYV